MPEKSRENKAKGAGNITFKRGTRCLFFSANKGVCFRGQIRLVAKNKHGARSAPCFRRYQLSQKALRSFALVGCLSLLMAFASIWRTLSLVTPKTLPTSSSV